ncbi:MAG: hypothetical protein ACTHQM_16900 [Thermoanaerobaculia bacterium]
MKHLAIAVIVFSLLTAPFAQAKTCFGISCNYIDAASNSNFQASPWDTNWSASGASSVIEGCFGTVAAEIGPGDTLTRGPFTVDNTYTNGFALQFRLQLPNDTDSAFDQLAVTVTDNTTSTSEVFYYNGNTFTSNCNIRVIPLVNDYSNHSVTVSFTGGGLTSHPWHLDDVGFFAYW